LKVHLFKAKDIIAYARQNQKKLTYGSGGIGTLGSPECYSHGDHERRPICSKPS
jgi:hypothetical protein